MPVNRGREELAPLGRPEGHEHRKTNQHEERLTQLHRVHRVILPRPTPITRLTLIGYIDQRTRFRVSPLPESPSTHRYRCDCFPAVIQRLRRKRVARSNSDHG